MERFAGRSILRASGVALLMSSCGTSPTAPTPAPSVSSSPRPTPPPPVARRLSGFVRDESSQPVAEAKVVVYGTDRSTSVVTTDSNGFYETVTQIATNLIVPWYEVTISKTGFDETSNGVLFRNNEDTTADFFLFRPVRLTAGEQQQLPVTFAGPLCGFELEYACRRVDVVASSDGTLTIEATANDPAVKAGVSPVQSGLPQPHSSIVLPVRAGQTVSVEILVDPSTPLSGGSLTLVPITFKTSLDSST